MTKLVHQMREELVHRNCAETTIRSYLPIANRRLDDLGTDDIRNYELHLLQEKKAGLGTLGYRVAARAVI